MGPENEIMVILATSNALTNYRDGKMKLTFEKMIVE